MADCIFTRRTRTHADRVMLTLATNPSEYDESAEAQQWRSMQRETMWLRAKICVLAHFCKVLRQRLDAAEHRHVDVAAAAVLM